MLDPADLRLIAITRNLLDDPGRIIADCSAAVRGGATMVQIRFKNASVAAQVEIARMLVASVKVPVILNDRADIALAAGAAGVHLGAADLPAAVVRHIVPPGFIIGASVGCTSEAGNAVGADYVGIGPVYASASKDDAGPAIGVEEFQRLSSLCGLPAVAIGGITVENAPEIMRRGASGIAVIQALLGASDPEQAARSLYYATGM